MEVALEAAILAPYPGKKPIATLFLYRLFGLRPKLSGNARVCSSAALVELNRVAARRTKALQLAEGSISSTDQLADFAGIALLDSSLGRREA